MGVGVLKPQTKVADPVLDENGAAQDRNSSATARQPRFFPGMCAHCDTTNRIAPHFFQVLRRTIFDGESQSTLLLGAKGTGKSLVLDRVLRSLAQEVASQAAAKAAGHGKRKRQKESAEESGGKKAGRAAGGSGGSGTAAAAEENAPSSGGDEGHQRPLSPLPQPEEAGPEEDTGKEERPQHRERKQKEEKQAFRAVYLNGAAQVDDGVAMREIVQQLGITGAATQGSIYNRSGQTLISLLFRAPSATGQTEPKICSTLVVLILQTRVRWSTIEVSM